MSNQDREWLTIVESSAYTGKSANTIRRLVKQMSNQNIKRVKQKIFVSKAFLASKYKILEQDRTPDQEDVPPKQDKGVLEELRNQLKTKDKQIDKLQDTIGALGERLRESNILLGTEQQKTKLLEQRLGLIDQPQTKDQGLEQVPDQDDVPQDQEAQEDVPPDDVPTTKPTQTETKTPNKQGLFGGDISNKQALFLMFFVFGILLLVAIFALGN